MIGRVLLGLLSVAIWADSAQAQGAAPAFQTGQYNSTLPTFASGGLGYLSMDSSGRLILSPGSVTGTYNASAPTLSNGQTAPLQFDVNGNLKVQAILNGGTATVFGAGNFNLGVTSAAGGISYVVRLASSGAGTNALLIKSGAGRVYKITGYNAASSVRWLHFYNVATSPTPGTTSVFFTLPLPPGAYSFDMADIGYAFSTGIAYSITAGAADSDTTNTAAGDIIQQNIWAQ